MTHLISRQAKSIFLWVLICIIVAALFVLPIANQSWAAVELRYFRANITSSLQAELEWATEVEDTAGYIVKRAESGGSIETISVLYNGSTVSFIAATGGMLGADYQAIDETAVAGKTYTYYLYEVENNNNQVEVASDTLTIEEESSSSSLTGNSSTSSNQSSSATATPRPTSTSPPTSVPTTQNNNSATGTNTSSNNESSSSASPTPRPTITRTNNDTTTESTSTSVESTTDTESQTEETTVTIDSQEDIVAEEESGTIEIGAVAIAQASEQESVEQQDEYPEPSIDPVATTDEAYVAPTVVPTATPADTGGSVQIGAGATVDSETVTESENNSEPTTTSANNRLILWGSFLGALLVFISGILGAIILFRRRQQE